ncbi:MAG: NnrS family protein [Alphaproteobacteria bacterium]|nr:NnrS family protein [Alphaproteobacteria bacterium]MBO6628363.1 NnrS family protein [Alphaproteobacteria bacterium]MDF1624750.1 NnrS family protein [Parvibaculaceae bacterium]
MATMRFSLSSLAFFSMGFRPFFLFACLWAGFALVLWLGILSGVVVVPTAFDPASWHAHEMLFGYLGAVFGGFLLTAVPNWTGRPPLKGAGLVGLVCLWLAGRGVVFVSAHLPALFVALVDLSLMIALVLYLGREITIGKNWRNLPVLVMLSLFIVGNGLFHLSAWQGDYAAGELGFRLGLGVAVMLISLIGGRIVPAFTQNWLGQQGVPPQPVFLPRLDVISMLISGLVLLLWIALGEGSGVGVGLLVMGSVQGVRLLRWRGHLTVGEPLVWVLHLGYGFVPMGTVALGLSYLHPGWIDPVSAQHFWMAGAIGLMTMAVMTRASLGHSGQALKAGVGTAALYWFLIAAIVTRIAGGYAGDLSLIFYSLSALFWCAGFFGFGVVYGPVLLSPRRV